MGILLSLHPLPVVKVIVCVRVYVCLCVHVCVCVRVHTRTDAVKAAFFLSPDPLLPSSFPF